MAEENAGAAPGQDKQVGIQRMYLKDCSFESPKAPQIFQGEWKPEVKLNISTQNARIELPAETPGQVFDVTLTVEVDAQIEKETALLCEVKYAGIFYVAGFTDEELPAVLNSFCPTQLFPFAREAITDLVMKGGFPMIPIQPINFDAMLAQRQREAAGAH
ncbi:MAG: protein-export chaperone SecB [Pseudomonadota bacterium]